MGESEYSKNQEITTMNFYIYRIVYICMSIQNQIAGWCPFSSLMKEYMYDA